MSEHDPLMSATFSQNTFPLLTGDGKLHEILDLLMLRASAIKTVKDRAVILAQIEAAREQFGNAQLGAGIVALWAAAAKWSALDSRIRYDEGKADAALAYRQLRSVRQQVKKGQTSVAIYAQEVLDRGDTREVRGDICKQYEVEPASLRQAIHRLKKSGT